MIIYLYDNYFRLLRLIKRFIVKRKFSTYGKYFTFDPDSTFINPHLIEIGDNVFIGEKAHFSSDTGIRIGDGVMFGPYSMIIGGDHNFSIVGKKMCEVHGGGINESVIIENDVWLGAHVVILKGVTVMEGSVVGACSVITRDIPPYCIAVGNPCRPLRPRFSQSQLREHLRIIRNSWDVEKVVMYWKKAGLSWQE